MIEITQENVGKKYELTTAKLFAKKVDNVRDGEKVEYDGFFCSELVAAAYKELNLIPKQIPSSQYWPVTFSQTKKINFLSDAKLDLEMVINFDLE